MKNDMIIEKLREKMISPSMQRIEVYKYLVEKRNHPTVEMIYQQLAGKIPTLSKTTVYNTLKLLISKGLVNEITIDKAESRYDAVTITHGHFLDEETGEIIDFEIDLEKANPEIFGRAIIREKHIYFKGKLKNN